MPKPAKPPAPAPAPHGTVATAGKQEDFYAQATSLAARLGWSGQPDWVTNDIAVEDARGFLMKALHEQFCAAACGHASSLDEAATAAAQHLGLDDLEAVMLADAFAEARQAGTGQPLTHHPITFASTGAGLTLNSKEG